MADIASLLNPDPSRTLLPTAVPALDSPLCLTAAIRDDQTPGSEHPRPSTMVRDSKSAKSRAKGVVNFPPFEDLDEAYLRAVRQFRVTPFGTIKDNRRHIPYNSGKRAFSRKTGREGFEVFQYEFHVPGHEKPYTVMWDYHIGLVRMTPFFKCCGYSKTTPAKMLNQNPGLGEITHSITGGSITAQGYWMPFECARAACAKFCYPIAGALIPLFGPGFPSQCSPPASNSHKWMIIDQEIIARAAQEAYRFRQMHSPYGAPPTPPRNGSSSPRLPLIGRRGYEYDRDLNFRYNDGPPVDTVYEAEDPMDVDVHPGTGVHNRFSFGNLAHGQPGLESAVAPRSVAAHSSSWRAVNRQPVLQGNHHPSQYHESRFPGGVGNPHDPILTALPRHDGRQPTYSYPQCPTQFTPSPSTTPTPDRDRFFPPKRDYGLTGRQPDCNPQGSQPTYHAPNSGAYEDRCDMGTQEAIIRENIEKNRIAAEKNAAMTLLNLCAPNTSPEAASLDDERSRNGWGLADPGRLNGNVSASSKSSKTTYSQAFSVPTDHLMAPVVLASGGQHLTKKRRATMT
ncbi:hypothetical protein OQA88_13040 [Cercophora sp. LCS_1]